MMHDMAITKDHVIIPGGGCVTSPERLQAGRPHWAWDATRPNFYAIIPRHGRAEDIRWFEGPSRSIVHTANAWSEDGQVVMDAPSADGNTWPWFEDVHGAEFKMNEFSIRRLRFDMRSNSNEVREEVLFEREVTSFTRVDDRLAGRPNRFIWVQFADHERPFSADLPDDVRIQPVNSYGRFDILERTMKSWYAGPTHVVQEPTFVPRAPDAPEGDGFLLGTAHNLAERRSELVVVDATKMVELARVILPFRNAYQVHGVWASTQDLPLT
jgi:carotenoid cleavage dioxygenase